MQDRPTCDELLAAVERFLTDQIVPHGDGPQAFHARVAANALRIVRRELAHADDHLAREWAGLERLLGPAPEAPGPTRNAFGEAVTARTEELCARIRQGDADASPFRDAVREHIRATVEEKLRVTNPKWLGEG